MGQDQSRWVAEEQAYQNREELKKLREENSKLKAKVITTALLGKALGAAYDTSLEQCHNCEYWDAYQLDPIVEAEAELDAVLESMAS